MGSGTTNLGAVLRDLRAQFGKLDIVAAGEDIRIGLPAETLGIVLAHLADNSEQHGATQFTVTAARNGDRTTLHVGDNGSGISDGNRERIFQPFFTTRRDSGGTGMGLDIVRAMLRAHDAEILLLSTANGAVFAISTPGA